MVEDIDIEWIQKDVVLPGARVHLRRTTATKDKVSITYTTLLLRNGVFSRQPYDWSEKTKKWGTTSLPKRWSASGLKDAARRATSFIEANHACFLLGDRLVLQPVRPIPPALLIRI